MTGRGTTGRDPRSVTGTGWQCREHGDADPFHPEPGPQREAWRMGMNENGRRGGQPGARAAGPLLFWQRLRDLAPGTV
jgi:hypothetical protein